MLAQLLEARQWVQHEVLAAAGSRPCELCFIIQGQVRGAQQHMLLLYMQCVYINT